MPISGKGNFPLTGWLKKRYPLKLPVRKQTNIPPNTPEVWRDFWLGGELTPVTISPTGIISLEEIPTQAVNIVLSPSGINSLETIGNPILSNLLSPVGIASGETFGNNEVSFLLSPEGINTNEAFGIPTLVLVSVVSPTGIVSGEVFGNDTVSLSLSPSSIPPIELFGIGSLNLALSPTGIVSGEISGNPSVIYAVSSTSILSEELFGVPNLSFIYDILRAGNISSLEEFGLGVVQLGVFPSGISSGLLFGTPRLTGDTIRKVSIKLDEHLLTSILTTEQVTSYPRDNNSQAHKVENVDTEFGYSTNQNRQKTTILTGDK